MLGTKPFVSKSFTHLRGVNSNEQRYHHQHDFQLGSMHWLASWRQAAVYKRRRYTRMLKVFIAIALLLTCMFNLKLLIDAKLKYEQHKAMFVYDIDVDIDDVAYFHRSMLEQKPTVDSINLELVSSKNLVSVKVNNKLVYEDQQAEAGRGIHVVVLNQANGEMMGSQVFDTFIEGQDELMIQYLKAINDENRMIAFAVKDEASMNLGRKTKIYLETLGSKMVGRLGWRSTWVMLCYNNGQLINEEMKSTEVNNEWAQPIHMHAHVKPLTVKDYSSCKWLDSIESDRRREFCSRYEGYGSLCDCQHPQEISFPTRKLENNRIYDVPVAVIASNRPQYLYRMLRSLLQADGVNKNNIIVFIDGHFEETMEVSRLFGVKGIYHTPSGVKSSRISQHYRSSLSATFDLNPDAEFMIIIEEDLDVAPDFFSYFNQVFPLFQSDDSIYCVSAWNDHGYHHSSDDNSLLYRVESMPGLGWMLRRSLFVEELEPNWPGPEKPWDWDMWMRHPEIRRGRECIIPDVSRTFHFGTSGVNMNNYFHRLYFQNHRINEERNVKLKNVSLLSKDKYEVLMHKLIMRSSLLDHTRSPCDDDFVSPASPSGQSYVGFFKMDDANHMTDFLAILKCLKLWDLDARGLHKSSFRTFVNHRHLIFVGYPASPYSLYKPVGLELLKVATDKNR
uniref:protein O-linked-mannose beta-1,2-N-acetylglucosaminyltransferase 1 n=1 Tax=Ciona intestinalis TaxID=7719 RepID=UPI000180D29D|nr:protein O-linked-mannose beta-1,2-N-acetylglucosaminyltransferase 1 [Ciona intestinalis]|eukprot:XP_002128274.1 protein O-linked-mannose beta-1,2-N-acetylglucosaminyltransferase 1 [Ciona intestinalis]